MGLAFIQHPTDREFKERTGITKISIAPKTNITKKYIK